MSRFWKTIEVKVLLRMSLWALLVLAGVAYYLFTDTSRAFTALYTENCHSRMLINYEYTRRVLSDVYVQVSNNVYQIESTLDNPNDQRDQMKRIVEHGNRIHSCGMNFVQGYYPQKGNRYCPFAWRNPENRNEILTDEKGDHDFDYLQARSRGGHSRVERPLLRWIRQRNSADSIYGAHTRPYGQGSSCAWR